MQRKSIPLILIALLWFSVSQSSHAASSSASYSLLWQIFDNGGGSADSLSYKIKASSIGQSVGGGVSTSTNYVLRNGPAFGLGQDTDDDGLTDIQEGVLGTDPGLADTDDDGLTDFEEVGADANYDEGVDTDPLNRDTDGDGLRDGDDPEPLVPAVPQLIPLLPPLLTWLLAALLLGFALLHGRVLRSRNAAGMDCR